MAHLLKMPELAAAATEATLDEWLTAEGASYAVGDVLATVETDKAVAEIPSDGEGVMVRHLVGPRTLVPVGAPIAVLGDPGEDVDVDAVLVREGVADVVKTEPQPATGPEPSSAAGQTSVPAQAPAATTPGSEGDRGRIFISPLARRLADEAGLRLEDIPGSGPRGRITKKDVLAAAERGPVAPSSSTSPLADSGTVASGTSSEPVRTPTMGSPYREIPHTRMRRTIASRLSASKQQAPHFYVRATLEVDALLQLRTELNELSERRISVNDLVVKAAGVALTRVPELNVTWHDDVVRQYERADVGIAVATDRGLLTPVVRSVESLGLTALATASADLREQAAAGRLAQSDLEGGSLCVSNLGMLDVEEFTAIINPPQAAILSVGRVREAVVVRDGAPAVAKVMSVVLAVDHRPVDGAVAARWMRAFTQLVQQPSRMLL